MTDKKSKLKKGISAIEILIVAALIIIGFTGLLGVISYSLRISTSVREISQANFIAQETIEAVKNFRDGTDWNTDGLRDYIPAGAIASEPYHPELDTTISPPKWELVIGPEIRDGFTRKVVFEKVSRDGNNNIEETYNPVNDDSGTRRVIATVSWKDKEVKIVTYLTSWK